jgi:uncharacterized membrane protein
MIFLSPLPWWVLGLLVAVASFTAYRAYARPLVPLSATQRGVLMALRLGVLLLLIVLLLRPVTIEPVAARDAVVPILIDHSRSMRLEDAGEERRIDRAIALVRDELVPTIDAEFQVEVLSFGEEVSAAELDRLQPEARRSDLTVALQAIRERYDGRAVAGVVVLSDGGDTSGREPADVSAQVPFPVYTVGVGSTRLARDQELLNLSAVDPGLTGSVVELAATVVSYGFDAAPIELRVLEDGRLLHTRRVTPPGDGSPAREVFRIAPKATAATLYTVDIPVDSSELVAENNTRSILVRSPGRPRRILMIEGAPGYEHSFLKRVWGEDPAVALDAVVRKGQNDRGEHTFYVQADSTRTAALAQGYPASRDALYVYDAVVFANLEGEFLRPDWLAMTVDFVAVRGGGLLVFGPLSHENRVLRDSPLADVVPLDWSPRGGRRHPAYALPAGEPQKLILTPDGDTHPMMQLGAVPSDTRERWAQVPALAGSVEFGGPRPGASLLAMTSAPGGGLRPLLAVQRYGSGRSMIFAGDGTWRWQMLRPIEDLTYETFWRQVARWLSASAADPVSVTATGGQALGDVVRLDVQARTPEYKPVVDATVGLRTTDPAGRSAELDAALADGASGRYAGEFRPDQRGVYRVEAVVRAGGTELGRATDWVLVGGADFELTDPRLNEAVLDRVASATGGRYLAPDDLEDLPQLLRSRAPSQAPPITRDLWHTSWLFGLLIGLLAVEWTLRRQWGLR